jgi:hypothetical protein
MTTNRLALAIASTMHAAYFDDTAAALTTYLNSDPADEPNDPLRDRLIAALDRDIADLLHNANLADLLPFAIDLDDDAHTALSDYLLADDSFLAPLADLILADHAAEI